MLSLEEKKYYSRQIIIDDIGEEGQIKLKNTRILVVGAGGLGCPSLQYLVAAGIGEIGIIDNDLVELSNLHRQVLFTVNDVGQNKAEVVRNKLSLLNPNIRIDSFSIRLNAENAKELFSQYDIILDCTDNYPTRFLINDACILLDKPFVSGSIYRFEGQVAVYNYQGGPTLRCVYPSVKNEELNLNCSLSGVIGILPGIIGLFQANEVIKIALSIGEVMNNKMLIYSAKNNSFDFIKIKRNSQLDYNSILKEGNLSSENYTFKCSTSEDVKQISYNETFQNEEANFIILDVREYYELPIFKGENVIQIPLSELLERIEDIPTSRNIIVACQSGMRSQNTIRILQEYNIINNYFNLEEGLSEEFIRLWEKKLKKQKTFS